MFFEVIRGHVTSVQLIAGLTLSRFIYDCNNSIRFEINSKFSNGGFTFSPGLICILYSVDFKLSNCTVVTKSVLFFGDVLLKKM